MSFVGPVTRLASAVGLLELGIVDPDAPGVAEAISRLLFRSIEDARATRGGHLPDWLVEDIKRNYIAPGRVRSLWAPYGHRFALARDGEIVATVHITREHDTIFTIDRHTQNVSAGAHPGFKPEGYHHVVNLSVRHELRRARLATAMFDGIVAHFRHLFDGVGLWVRADPPWHPGLSGLGFVHDPSRDRFLGPEVERTRGLPHAAFNQEHACDCPGGTAAREQAMREQKLQYLSFTRDFAVGRARPRPANTPGAVSLARDEATRAGHATDFGEVLRVVPQVVARPANAHEVAAALARARAEGLPVAVRGRGQSAAGQALTAGLVVSTERLDRVLALEDDRVTVEAGVTLEALARQGCFLPVMTGWLPATVGGVLASGGYSKGSHTGGFVVDHVLGLVVVTGDGRTVACSPTQAAWLFDAALGGMGAFGVIVKATLRRATPPPFVTVTTQRATALADDLKDFDEGTVHRAAYGDDQGFVVVTARAATAGLAFADYVAPPREARTSTPSMFLHAFLPHAGLEGYLRAVRREGDAIQVIPVRNLRRARPSLLQLPEEDLVFAVSITRPPGPPAFEAIARFGGRAYLAGTPPPDLRAHLGAQWDPVVRAKALADPDNVLGGLLRIG